MAYSKEAERQNKALGDVLAGRTPEKRVMVGYEGKKDKDKHTGLGLSISRKIIDSFKGSINLIENNYEIYQGACFEIKLPLKG